MAHATQDCNLETDNEVDWSHLKSRVESFQDSGLAKQVPAGRLARAGFYFTGPADRVCCFSCKIKVENWNEGDQPVERHKMVSPKCSFLTCIHQRDRNGAFNSSSSYDEEAESMEFRLRTGEVVDESMYPKVPHMRSEDARFWTFRSWSSRAPVRPRSLAQAGLFYMGESDRVQCFCCGGMLGGWEAGDTAWEEHSKHFSNCFFILGHDVGNVPSQGSAEEVEEEEGEGEGGSGSSSRQQPSFCVLMGSFHERLQSYAGIQHPIDSEKLARAGFYSPGIADHVMCFHCGGGIKSWQPDEDPWIEHAKHYPGCSFLLTEKGQDFVNQVQLQQNAATSSQNGFPRHQNELLQSEMAREALGIGLDPATVERTILEKLGRTGLGYTSTEALIHDCLNSTLPSDATSKEEDPIKKLQQLQREKQCKICMDQDICMVFIPCGHLVCCAECSKSLSKCPICCSSIAQKLKTYIT
ncbi:E3 ubiquitin-protein ligase XIAP [Merluccius polli]|uniref:E3 ubiquitin-protein ligase XIAP n=1 Tax=Merluccius polli TaxID=89951 RepID=A0AA47P467_MERPO|nr:E3 ubiquitin-protein ligase XIAP [Merluccius polli]